MSKVFFSKSAEGLEDLFRAAEINKIIQPDDLVALKIHFGERGNQAYIKSARVKPIVKLVKDLNGRPFWTDTNTLYKGSRHEALAHLQTADDHGYSLEKTGASVIIADGLEGRNSQKVPVNGKYFKEVLLGSLVLEADTLIALTHFKGHEVVGFGGAIKNISMGLASRAGKQQMHADLKPVVNKNKCTSCGRCVKWCPENTIALGSDKKASINLDRCLGCAECVAACRFGAIAINWSGEPDSVQGKMAEYALGVKNYFKEKIVFLNFLTDISPNCDCYPHNDPPIVPDIGLLASYDPVALDQASVDLVNQSGGRISGQDKFKTLWPEVDWEIQLQYGAELGLGDRKYDLIEI